MCSISSCKNQYYARMFCKMHYARFRRHGDPNIKFQSRSCSILGCNKKYFGKGYCPMHYQRVRFHGDPHYADKLRNKNRICSIKNCDRKHDTGGLCAKHYMQERRKDPIYKEKHRLYMKTYNMNNPSSGGCYSYDLQDAMNNVRIRDNNTCQWYGCGITNREISIHVHHIFPRNEYPELELVEQYMICYCKEHHSLWHYKRGDKYFKFIKK